MSDEQIFEFDAESTDSGGSTVNDAVVAPGSDAPTVQTTTDDGFQMDELAMEELPASHVEAAPPPLLSLPVLESAKATDLSSASNSPRTAMHISSVRSHMTLRAHPTAHAAENVFRFSGSLPTLTGKQRVGARSGTAPNPMSASTTLARASIAMLRCKTTFDSSNLKPCLFCQKKYAIGHAVLTLSHRLYDEDDLQLCALEIGLICCDCAPVYLSKEDARAVPYKILPSVFLKRRLTFFINMLQNMNDTPIPDLNYVHTQTDVTCVNCKGPVDSHIQRNPLSVMLLKNKVTAEHMIFVVCSSACRQSQHTVLDAMNKSTKETPSMMMGADDNLYNARHHWEPVEEAEMRTLFPNGTFSIVSNLEMHGVCTNPHCFVCDLHDATRQQSVRTGYQRRGTLVRSMAQENSLEKTAKPAAPINDNFAFLQVIFERIKKENVFIDLLGSPQDVHCLHCKRACDSLCQKCGVAPICSDECAARAKHRETCFGSRPIWSEMMRH